MKKQLMLLAAILTVIFILTFNPSERSDNITGQGYGISVYGEKNSLDSLSAKEIEKGFIERCYLQNDN